MRVSVLLVFVPAMANAAFTCADCHKAAAHSQPVSFMGRALMVPGANPVLTGHPKLTYSRGAYSYLVETAGTSSTYAVTDGVNSITLPIVWGFGARSQTFVMQYNGRYYESLVSYYPKIDELGITIGDERIVPKTLLEAFGRELHDSETKSCFGCHAQGPVEPLRPEALVPGVHCENCHAEAQNHLTAFSNGQTKPVPRKLSKQSPEEISNLCGQCHRTWDRVVRDRLRGEINVRFQPYRLSNSKCYDGADKRLSCIACHNPHEDAAVGPASYDGRCLACHNSGPGGKIRLCPVGTAGCSNCHMPKVELPGGMQVFTDHQIRIVRAGEPYPN